MTKVEQEALKVYPEDYGTSPMVDDNEHDRLVYMRGAKDFCRKIWAMVKVMETEYVGRYLDEKITLCELTDKLNEISMEIYEMYNEPSEE